MGTVDFAVASFGQNFGITPIQMITGQTACGADGCQWNPDWLTGDDWGESYTIQEGEYGFSIQLTQHIRKEDR